MRENKRKVENKNEEKIYKRIKEQLRITTIN